MKISRANINKMKPSTEIEGKVHEVKGGEGNGRLNDERSGLGGRRSWRKDSREFQKKIGQVEEVVEKL